MKRNMLFITTQFPYPLDNGGKIGAFNGISVVSRDFNVTVISFSEEPENVNEGIKYYEKKLQNVTFINPVIHDVHIRKKPLKLACSLLNGYLKKLPYIVSKFYDKKMLKLIDSLFVKNSYDIVFIDYLNMAFYGDYIKQKYSNKFHNIILKDHNVEYELVKQEYESSRGFKKILLKHEWKRTFKYETNRISDYELVFTVCDENTEKLNKYNPYVYTMFPTYEMLESREKLTNKNNIIYMGNLSWKCNYEGIMWFAEKVLPEIVKKVPDTELIIAGGGIEGNPFCNFKNINYLGYIDNPDDLYKQGKVFIVPLFEGSGIRIKILESFNNEIPVVSTTIGCNTIGADHSVNILKADTPEDFADCVIDMLKDNKKNEQIRKSGKKLLSEKYSLSTRQKEFKKIYNEVLNKLR